MKAARKTKPAATIRIDLGCGEKKYKGGDESKPDDSWIGIDCIAFPGVDHVLNIGTQRWPFANGTVAEAYSCHTFEHLDQIQRVHFVNEMWRVLVPGGKGTLVAPHWSSCRAYGDPTHAWPPLSEFAFYYFDKDWRMGNPDKNMLPQAAHTDKKHWKHGFDCDFEVTVGYGLNPAVLQRNQAFIQDAMMYFKEAIFDLHITLIKRA